MVRALQTALKLPAYGLVDCGPFGLSLLLTYVTGSVRIADHICYSSCKLTNIVQVISVTVSSSMWLLVCQNTPVPQLNVFHAALPRALAIGTSIRVHA
jgi:hypothetical protein